MNSIKWFFKRIIHVLKWIPVVWGDYEWDQYYIFRILRFKLYNTGKYFYNNGVSFDNDKMAAEIKVCVHLLDRIMKDEYDLEACDQLEEKWGEYNCIWKEIDNGSELVNIYRDKVFSKKDEERYRKDFIRENNRAETRKKYDIQYLFHIMNRKIRTWWD